MAESPHKEEEELKAASPNMASKKKGLSFSEAAANAEPAKGAKASAKETAKDSAKDGSPEAGKGKKSASKAPEEKPEPKKKKA